jgi:hypothetical protein
MQRTRSIVQPVLHVPMPAPFRTPLLAADRVLNCWLSLRLLKLPQTLWLGNSLALLFSLLLAIHSTRHNHAEDETPNLSTTTALDVISYVPLLVQLNFPGVPVVRTASYRGLWKLTMIYREVHTILR